MQIFMNDKHWHCVFDSFVYRNVNRSKPKFYRIKIQILPSFFFFHLRKLNDGFVFKLLNKFYSISNRMFYVLINWISKSTIWWPVDFFPFQLILFLFWRKYLNIIVICFECAWLLAGILDFLCHHFSTYNVRGTSHYFIASTLNYVMLSNHEAFIFHWRKQ